MAKRQLHKLSVREAETIGEPGRHSDGGWLYLVIEAGARAVVLRGAAPRVGSTKNSEMCTDNVSPDGQVDRRWDLLLPLWSSDITPPVQGARAPDT
jgi:hypothetical protein